MKRKERKPLVRVFNTLSFIVLACSSIFMAIWETNMIAITSALVAFSCIATPVAIASEGTLQILGDIAETFLHAMIDSIMGIFEAISSLF